MATKFQPHFPLSEKELKPGTCKQLKTITNTYLRNIQPRSIQLQTQSANLIQPPQGNPIITNYLHNQHLPWNKGKLRETFNLEMMKDLLIITQTQGQSSPSSAGNSVAQVIAK